MRFGVFFSAAILLVTLQACRRARPELPDYGVVPPFQLVSQDGGAFNSGILKGNIWVADFFFTTCPGPCPRMTSQMHQIQEAAWRIPNVKLVSFTVDPARDTPQKLAAYAKAHHADPEHWYFLTGPQATLNHLGLDAFKLNSVDGSLQHSTRFTLVDKSGHIRGYYDTSDPKSIPKLVADIHALAREAA
jgi:protein SCO1/2